jgi:hypothetical protein
VQSGRKQGQARPLGRTFEELREKDGRGGRVLGTRVGDPSVVHDDRERGILNR